MLSRLKKTYSEFPPLFWIIVITLFIDSLGSTLLFPFFALYITQKFGVGMTQAGVLLGLSSLFGLIGSVIGGALTDKFGRRQLILFGLVFSALSSLLFGLAWDVKMLYFLVVIVGLLSRISNPAQDAMLAVTCFQVGIRMKGLGMHLVGQAVTQGAAISAKTAVEDRDRDSLAAPTGTLRAVHSQTS